MAGLRIVPLYFAAQLDLLEHLRARLARIFGLPTALHAATFDPETTFDASRGQYNSTALLAALLAEPVPTDERLLAVASVDLFIPVLTYVFGEAQLDGRAAVISTYRLRNEIYGLPADEGLLFGRCEKEAVHELGHTYGLLHCSEASCVMLSSTYVGDIDLKSAQFCERCAATLRRALRART